MIIIIITFRHFLPYTPSQHLKPTFIKASMVEDTYSLNVAVPPIEVRNTDLAHLFA